MNEDRDNNNDVVAMPDDIDGHLGQLQEPQQETIEAVQVRVNEDRDNNNDVVAMPDDIDGHLGQLQEPQQETIEAVQVRVNEDRDNNNDVVDMPDDHMPDTPVADVVLRPGAEPQDQAAVGQEQGRVPGFAGQQQEGPQRPVSACRKDDYAGSDDDDYDCDYSTMEAPVTGPVGQVSETVTGPNGNTVSNTVAAAQIVTVLTVPVTNNLTIPLHVPQQEQQGGEAVQDVRPAGQGRGNGRGQSPPPPEEQQGQEELPLTDQALLAGPGAGRAVLDGPEQPLVEVVIEPPTSVRHSKRLQEKADAKGV